MEPLRVLIREHRHLALALFALAFFMKALVPSGFMVSASNATVVTVTICSDGASDLKRIQMVIPGKEQGSSHPEKMKQDTACAFSGLAKVAIGADDAFLLALAVAFILLLGFSPVRRLPFRQASKLRPPLRAPPSAA